MNNFHIYEEVGRGKYSVVYKVLIATLILSHPINITSCYYLFTLIIHSYLFRYLTILLQGRKKKAIDYVAVKSVEKNRRKKVLNEVNY